MIDANRRIEKTLTSSEERVVRLVGQSMTNREIASRLGISPATVKRHLENILRKLQMRNRLEVAIYGLTLLGCHARSHSECPLAAWSRLREQRNRPNAG